MSSGYPVISDGYVAAVPTEPRRSEPRRSLAAMDADVRTLLTTTKTWAVVGCSPDPSRDSHRIAALLQRRGFTIVPVNPREDQILGERCYPSVTAIPADVTVDVVDVFRRSDQAGAH